MSKTDILARLHRWIMPVGTTIDIPDWGNQLNVDHVDAMNEIATLRQRVTDLLTYTNAFEARARAAEKFMVLHPADDWHEDMGDVLWWKLPITEPPYVGTPLDLGFTVEVRLASSDDPAAQLLTRHVGGWPGYHTHFSLIPPVRERRP